MKCLVVDDSTTMRRILVNALKRIGVTDVVEAGNGSQALQACDPSIELVITDWNMPVMDGLELVRSLRANDATTETPVLMVTTRSVPDDIKQAAEAGVNGYILKPITPQVLKEKISEITTGRSAGAGRNP